VQNLNFRVCSVGMGTGGYAGRGWVIGTPVASDGNEHQVWLWLLMGAKDQLQM